MMTKNNDSAFFNFFFGQPIFSILALILFIMGGFIAYQSMIKETYPDLEIPQALIYTEWPGASPELVEKEITNKIESKIKSLKGLKRYRSGSQNSVSIISVEFDTNADLQESMQLLRTKVNESYADFPKDAKMSSIEPISVSDEPVMTFMMYGDLDEAVLSKISLDLKQRLERIQGIKKIELGGYRKEIVRIQLIPDRLREIAISPLLVKEKIVEANNDLPWGEFENDDFIISFKLAGRFTTLQDLEKLPIIRLESGRVVRLGEIATIRRDLDIELNRAFLSTQGNEFNKCIAVWVYKLPGKDSILLNKKVKAEVEKFSLSSDWPVNLKYQIVFDDSIKIWNNLISVFNNCWQAMLAVFLILFLMLTWREALIAGLSIPVTFLGALLFLWIFGHSVNEMIVIGMVLALGLLVDDFILMMEGMHDGIFVKRNSYIQSVKNTVETYAMPSLSGSLTTIMVLLPMMAIGGLDGKFIRLIPVTAIICLVLSYFVSIFIDLPLSGFLLKSGNNNQKGKIDILSEKLSNFLYKGLIQFAVKNKLQALLWFTATMILFFLATDLLNRLPSQLYPKEDGLNLGITIELAPESSLDKSQEIADKVGCLLRQKNYFKCITKYVGRKSPFSLLVIDELLEESESAHIVGFSCFFIPKHRRPKMAFEYVPELRKEIEHILSTEPSSNLVITPQLGGSTSNDPIQIEISGDNMETLRSISRDIQDYLKQIPGTTDVRDNLGLKRMDTKLIPKREALDFYNISQNDLAFQIRMAMDIEKIGKFKMPGTMDDLNMIIGTSWTSRKGEIGGPKEWEELSLLHVINPEGQRIPLMSLVDYIIDEANMTISHKDGKRTVIVKARTNNRTANEILNDLKQYFDTTQLPEGYQHVFAGEYESSSETYGSAGKVFVLGLFLIFSILAMLFNSFLQPFIIMFSVCFALIGTFGGFFLAWIPVSFPAMIGIISLTGIVVNDAIVMIETMNHYTKKGLPVNEAAARGSSDRLRPIISTTLTTIVGLIPLALSNPMWMPLCNAIIFGLIASTIISILLIPCLFVLFSKKST
jgi:multidrug efflux pump subunit AcrB